MVFSSPTFLFLFLPLSLLAYGVAPARARNLCLLLAGVVFYVWGAGGEILVLLYVSAVSFLGARVVRARPGRRVLAGVVLALLAPLVVYKYLPTASLFGSHWALPLGISFFTFHAISYVVDCRAGVIPPERSVRDYLLYLFLFPHQIAGPIVRYAEIVGELKDRREVTLGNLTYGCTRFCWGLAKKAFIADSVGTVADAAFGAGSTLSPASAWLGALAYALQLYFDFSGYSDMAIGLAAMFGFRFPENFSAPYRAIGPADFWRRWHMTLSRWFRDYVYIPLGGNRHGLRREYAALLITFALTALWHGAAWTFLVWGGLHSLALLLERLLVRLGGRFLTRHRLRAGRRLHLVRRVLMLVFLVVSWVPFRAPTLHGAVGFWTSMLGGAAGSSAWSLSPQIILTLTPATIVSLGLGCLVAVGPRDLTGFQIVYGRRPGFSYPRAVVTAPLLLVVAVIAMLWLDFSPFLYFQF